MASTCFDRSHLCLAGYPSVGRRPRVASDWGNFEVFQPPPILVRKDFDAPSVFEPENLLREARRQKNLTNTAVPEICLLDPDGDIVRALARTGRSQRSAAWACYHTDLYEFDHAGEHFGIIGCAVG